MKIQRTILKCKSKFYYYTLMLIGSASFLFFVRCSNQNYEGKFKSLQDSLVKAKIRQDSIIKADSVSSALKEQAKRDSTAKADSIAKALQKKVKKTKPVNSYVPKYNAPCEYGVGPIDEPKPMYGIMPNDFQE